MRIWSIHPKYLDAKGLVALWRETLLAKNVLEGKTVGYKNHPQLNRFKNTPAPLVYINQYLHFIYDEAKQRAYNFDKNKMGSKQGFDFIIVTEGQVRYEIEHLLQKLKLRDPKKFLYLNTLSKYETHPLFKIVPGKIENWELIKK